MAEAERTYEPQFNERALYVLALDKPEDFPDQLALASPRFACLLAWDVRAVDDAGVALLARKLVDAGAVFIGAWGPDCERIHDIVDKAAAGPNPPPVADKVVMTVWHADVPLGEALWDIFYCSVPDEASAAGCDSTLGITIGSPEWAKEMRAAFTDPIGFSSRLLHEQH